jgi:hypothetical protein
MYDFEAALHHLSYFVGFLESFENDIDHRVPPFHRMVSRGRPTPGAYYINLPALLCVEEFQNNSDADLILLSWPHVELRAS